jgi:hypothetical protein
MPILTMISLAILAIKVGVMVTEYLKAHPELLGDAKAHVESVHSALVAAQYHIEEAQRAQGDHTEAP